MYYKIFKNAYFYELLELLQIIHKTSNSCNYMLFEILWSFCKTPIKHSLVLCKCSSVWNFSTGHLWLFIYFGNLLSFFPKKMKFCKTALAPTSQNLHSWNYKFGFFLTDWSMLLFVGVHETFRTYTYRKWLLTIVP